MTIGNPDTRLQHDDLFIVHAWHAPYPVRMAKTSTRGAAGATGRMRSSDIVIDDGSISLAAKGVFVMIGFLGGSCTVADVYKHCSDETDLLPVVDELVTKGYVNVADDQITVRDPAVFGLPDY